MSHRSFPTIALLATILIPLLAQPAYPAVEKGIIILTQFPDVKNELNRRVVYTRFAEQLDSYVRQMSYGKVSLNISLTPRWYTMPSPVTAYRISPRNLEVDRSRVRKLIDDALAAAEKDVDFSKYSLAVIFMGAELKDYGMIGLCGYPGMLGWSEEGALKTRGGQSVNGGVAIFSYQAHLGTLFHDVAHVLGGVKGGRRMVPCLYDHELQAKPGPLRETAIGAMVNMGFWDPMSCHYRERGVPPPGISSWTKMRLGWIDRGKVKIINPGEKAEFVLGPLEEGSSDVLAVKIPVSATTYYLVENRQPIGFDKYLPGSGVLIMFADDGVLECHRGKAPVKLVNANPSVPHLEGAAFDIGKNASFSDNANRVTVQLKEKVGSSYRLFVSNR